MMISTLNLKKLKIKNPELIDHHEMFKLQTEEEVHKEEVFSLLNKNHQQCKTKLKIVKLNAKEA